MSRDIAPAPESPASDVELLGEAADWILRMREGRWTPDARRELEQWRQLSPAHEEAWRRAETVLGTFGNVPTDIGREVLRSLGGTSRRRALRTLGLLVAAGPAGWLTWRAQPWLPLTADVATATGERRAFDLTDGSRVVLNSGSAVDIAFTPDARRLRLNAGEILVTTHRDAMTPSRPFLVETMHGTVRALGTRFSVRRFDAESRVMVFEHAVEITPQRAAAQTFQAGEQGRFDRVSVQAPRPVEASAAAWERGMLAATSMRLADVIAELARYRRGVLRCDPAVADLQFSGALSVDDTEAALQLLARHLPVRISRVTPYWVTVGSI